MQLKKFIETTCNKPISECSNQELYLALLSYTKEQIKEKEAERVRKVLKDSAYTIALAIDGKQMTSENFAEKIQGLGIRGESHICFLIGGSLGMSDSLLRQADERISFSKMTFPHQLMRVILLEQIYRGFRIIHHEPYHK